MRKVAGEDATISSRILKPCRDSRSATTSTISRRSMKKALIGSLIGVLSSNRARRVASRLPLERKRVKPLLALPSFSYRLATTMSASPRRRISNMEGRHVYVMLEIPVHNGDDWRRTRQDAFQASPGQTAASDTPDAANPTISGGYVANSLYRSVFRSRRRRRPLPSRCGAEICAAWRPAG